MEALGKKYEIVATTEGLPCEHCCFTEEECFEIVDTELRMACGCEFGGKFHCEEI